MSAAPSILSPEAVTGAHGSSLQRFVLPSSPKPYYNEDGITIYHGDNRQIVPLLPRFDLLLTDPPYGLNERWNGGNFKGKNGNGKLWGEKTPEWDKEPAPAWMVQQCIEAARLAIIWGGNYYAMPPSRCWLTWDKVQQFHGADCELAWTNLESTVRAFRMSRIDAYQNKADQPKQHPTEKPLELMAWCIQQAGEVQTILDPYAGAGTTGRAAKDAGKTCVLIEREERYCEIAARRMAQGVLWRQNNAVTGSEASK